MQPPSLGVIDEVDVVGLKVTVLKAAMELDVFTTIAGGYHTAEEIAAALQCGVRGMRVLLDALFPLGLLHKSGRTYALTPTSHAYLVRGAPTACIDIYLTLLRKKLVYTSNIKTKTSDIDEVYEFNHCHSSAMHVHRFGITNPLPA